MKWKFSGAVSHLQKYSFVRIGVTIISGLKANYKLITYPKTLRTMSSIYQVLDSMIKWYLAQIWMFNYNN